MNISVIIPTFNRLNALRTCVRALHEQTCSYDDFEVLVVDDGSTYPIEASGLLDQIDKSLLQFQLRIIRQVNSGPAVARNFGAREAKGKLLAFIDDDCVADANWLEKLIETSRQHPQALVGGESRNAVHDNVFCVANQLILDIVYDHYNADPHKATFLASNNWLCRRDLFFKIGGFDESFLQAGGEDRDFCSRWRAAHYSIVWQKDALAEHRHYQNFANFLNMHFRYGRGACSFHMAIIKSDRLESKSTVRFYVQLLPRLMRHIRNIPSWWKRKQLVGLLFIWQVVNVLGFLQQMLRGNSENSKIAVGAKKSGLVFLKASDDL